MKKQIYISILFIFVVIQLQAQAFEEYYRQKNVEYEQHLEEREAEYQQYISDQEKEFAEMLKKEWEMFEMKAGKSYVSKPKPDRFPIYVDSIKQEFRIMEIEPSYRDTVLQQPSIRNARPTESFFFYKTQKTSFTFYGEPVLIEHPDIETLPGKTEYDNKIISHQWEKLNGLKFDKTTHQLLLYKDSLQLNDWGYYLLVRDFTHQLASDNEYYKLLMWYLLLHSKYNVKIGYTSQQLSLLIPFNTSIYEVPYYNISGEIFYVFENEKPGTIKSYIPNYPEAIQVVEPSVSYPPKFTNGVTKKQFPYIRNQEVNSISIMISSELQDFYDTFPLMELDNYFHSVMSDYASASLKNYLERGLTDRTEEQAVSDLLHFTQNAFAYKTDQEQFGKEKVFFPDEMFFYNYSDCEDRSIFFAYLVMDLLGLKVIGLEYPNHVAVGVCFNQPVEGNYVVWKGERYTICDPTYINAPIGITLPGHLESKASIIGVNN